MTRTRITILARVFALAAALAPLSASAQPADVADPPAPPPAPEPPPTPAPDEAPAAPKPTAATESDCKNRIDDDGDSVTDCADADCYERAECRPTGTAESTNLLCSDWIDNDGDGALDCDDSDCEAPGLSACKGSWKGASAGGGDANADELPEMPPGTSVEDLVGRGKDADGERNDELCSNGVDDDGDGRTDCADFGCRFDQSVRVCAGTPGLKLSVVASVAQTYRIEDTRIADLTPRRWDTRFSLLQLRALGPIPGIQNSFFLLSTRWERTPRLTFAVFQLPIGNDGHFVNVNSGGGGLTSGLIISASKQLLLEPPFYLYSAFEQGNGAAVEAGGPLAAGGKVRFRVFAAGGSGQFTGNVGGRFFNADERNYTWGSGAQLQLNAIGYWDRADTPFIYTPTATTLWLALGGKYDQRAAERFPAVNVQSVLRWDRLVLTAELYAKRELDFKATQIAYTATAGFLLWDKTLFAVADFGEFLGSERDRDERQWRAGLHWYAYKNTGVISLLYKNHELKSSTGATDGYKEQQVQAVAGYRF